MGIADYQLPLDQLPDPLPIVPITRPFDVTMRPPGSKSITNRVYILAALSRGRSRIVRPLRSEDTDGLLDALCTLGAEARWEGDDVFITGVDGRFPRGGDVNLGDGGTPTRFMIAAACLAMEPVTVDGSKRMRERPIAEGVEMLRQLGADIAYVEEEGRLPVRITPSDSFKGGTLTVGKTQSSQFISAVMLVSEFMEPPVDLQLSDDVTSVSYIQLTKATLQTWEGTTPFVVEPDASGAVYWSAAAALHEGASIDIPGIDANCSVQPDAKAMAALGSAHEPIRDAALCPDGALAMVAAYAGRPNQVTITGLHTLRVKETDRLTALANELGKIGCAVSTTDDSITVDPSARHDEPVVINTYNDHRMAMAFAILGTARPGISIENPACVAKSYPGFWRDLGRLYD